jgi:3-deoxy-D-manno-octulosonic-acid transferase
LQPGLRYSNADTTNVTNINVMIVDQIGFLSQLYQYADVAYIGGGFEKGGIHNILEAAVFGMPILFGPNYKKFQEAHDLIALGAAKSISTTDEFVRALRISTSLNDRATPQPLISADYVNQKKGATTLILSHIEK